MKDPNSMPLPRTSLEFVLPRIYVSLPNVGPAEVTLKAEDSPVERHLAADLMILYAFDMDTHFQLVAQRDLARLNVSAEDLHQRALANLRALKLQVHAHPGEHFMMLSADGNYEATLTLLPELWESVGGIIEGNIVVAVPARDVILVAGDSRPENLSELRRVTSLMLEQVEKPLSRAFLQWDGAGWKAYRGHAE